MPYVYVEELGEGQEAAAVIDAAEAEGLNARIGELESAAEEAEARNSALSAERDDLARQLDEAKQKFANAFLSSPERAKIVQRDDVAQDSKPMTFQELFNERNKYDAN